MPPLLTVQNLTVDFHSQRGQTRAVAGISFEVNRGEVVAIVGESGSGKSVTSLALLGLLAKPAAHLESGTARFASKKLGEVDLLRLTETQLQQVRGNDISMIFQEPMTSLNPVLTCGYQVVEALRLHTSLSKPAAEARTIELFAEAQLPRPAQIFKAYPHEISGGQKQRVMIAMAMACRPALLIADEPTTALDVTVQARILQLIRDLRCEYSTAVLFITHDLGVVAEIADRILVMYQGRVVEQGTVLDIFTNPQHPYTRGLLACRPRLSIGQERLPVVADFMTTNAAGNLVARAAKAGEGLLKSPSAQLRTNSDTSNTFPVEQNSCSTEGNVQIEGQLAEALVANQPLLQVENLRVYFPIRKGFFARTTSFVRAVDEV
ncbi:MAG: ATP-binding cassette domain-containing protein, partial [Janthinobacterium lividum]